MPQNQYGRRMKSKLMILSVLFIAMAITPCAPAHAEDSGKYFYINVQPNGSAIWIVENMIVLSSASDVGVWNQTITANSGLYLQQYEKDVISSVLRSSDATGREMSASEVELDFHVSPMTGGPSDKYWLGVIEYRFTWNGFAEVNNGVIEVGDVFVHGFYMESDNTLYISPPPGYHITKVTPDNDAFSGETAVWFGDMEMSLSLGLRVFDPGFPQLEMQAFENSAAGGMTDFSEIGGGLVVVFGAAGLIGIAGTLGWYKFGNRKSKAEIENLLTDREKLISLIQKAPTGHLSKLGQGLPDRSHDIVPWWVHRAGGLRPGNQPVLPTHVIDQQDLG